MHALNIVAVLLLCLVVSVSSKYDGKIPEGAEWIELLQGVKMKLKVSAAEKDKTTKPIQVSEDYYDYVTLWYETRTLDGTLVGRSYGGKEETIMIGSVVPAWRMMIHSLQVGDEIDLFSPADLAGKRQDVIFDLRIKGVVKATIVDKLIHHQIIVTAVLGLIVYYFLSSLVFRETPKDYKPLPSEKNPSNPVVVFEVSISKKKSEIIEMELFNEIVPKTVENFKSICDGHKIGSYKNTLFHRIIPGFMIQGGDIGGGGCSIYGKKFEDEWTNGAYRHTEPFLLSMANHGPDTNGSQFFITTEPTRWLDGKHVVFGRVISGQSVVKEIEATGTSGGRPNAPTVITKCYIKK